MATELVELGRVRMDRLRARRPDLFRKSMGQDLPIPAEPYQSIPPKPDMDQVYSVQELQDGLTFTNSDEALDYYKLILRIIAIRRKVAFLADLWARVKSNPQLPLTLLQSDEGRTWLEAFTRAESALLSFTQPNYSVNLGRLLSIMETHVLVGYGIGVVGRMPTYLSGQTEMSYSDVSTVSSMTSRTYDFGDLSQTLLADDIDEMTALANKLGVKAQMGITTLAIALIVAGVVIVTGLISWTVVHLANPTIPDEIKNVLKGLDPKSASDLLKQWMNASNFFGQLTDIFKWIAIGAGTLIVGGIVYVIFAD